MRIGGNHASGKPKKKMSTENYDKKIAEIRADIRKIEKAIANAVDEEEANHLKNIQSDYQRDLDEALTAKERKW